MVANNLSGRTTVNSGAGNFSGGDVLTELFLIECKTTTTDKKSFSIKEEWLLKNKKEALSLRKPFYCLAFNFGPDKPNYYVVDESVIKSIKEVLKNGEN